MADRLQYPPSTQCDRRSCSRRIRRTRQNLRLNFDRRRRNPKVRVGVVLGVGSIGFSLVYFFGTEFEEQLFPALMPLYCVGTYLLITRWTRVSSFMQLFYLIGVLFSLNLFGYQWLCQLLPLA